MNFIVYESCLSFKKMNWIGSLFVNFRNGCHFRDQDSILPSSTLQMGELVPCLALIRREHHCSGCQGREPLAPLSLVPCWAAPFSDSTHTPTETYLHRDQQLQGTYLHNKGHNKIGAKHNDNVDPPLNRSAEQLAGDKKAQLVWWQIYNGKIYICWQYIFISYKSCSKRHMHICVFVLYTYLYIHIYIHTHFTYISISMHVCTENSVEVNTQWFQWSGDCDCCFLSFIFLSCSFFSVISKFPQINLTTFLLGIQKCGPTPRRLWGHPC